MAPIWRMLAAALAVATVPVAAFLDGMAKADPGKTNGTTPMQLRLAYAGDTAMMVSWNTYDKLKKPTVKYGLSAESLHHTASSSISVTYATSSTYNNHVKITGLKPDTEYFYQPEFSNVTKPYTFRTSRPAGNGKPYSVAVVVDLGTMGNDGLTTHVGKGADNPLKLGETNTIESLAEHKSSYDFLWHAGDIAYADYWLKEEIQGFEANTTIAEGAKVYEKILNEFYDQMSNISSEKAYLVGPGNHEANCDNGGYTDKTNNISYTVDICMPGQTNFTGYRNHFRMPSAESGGLGNFWYSWDHGMAHYIQIDTETDLGHNLIGPDEPGGSEEEDSGPFSTLKDAQTNWLENDLKHVNRSKTPWIIVAGHRPWYISISNDSSDVCLDCQKVFEPLFIKYSVDLVLSGHVHAYQRNDPISLYNIDPNGLNNPSSPWYITNGAAGHYDGLDTLDRPLQKYAKVGIDTVYGWSKLTFHNCTHLTQEFVASGNGSVVDRATLYKERTCHFD